MRGLDAKGFNAIIRTGGHKDDGAAFTALPQNLRQLDAVRFPHEDIQQHDIRLRPSHIGQEFFRIGKAVQINGDALILPDLLQEPGKVLKLPGIIITKNDSHH